MNARLRLLIPLPLLVILGLGCSFATNLFTRQVEGGTVPETVAPPAGPTLAGGAHTRQRRRRTRHPNGGRPAQGPPTHTDALRRHQQG